GPSATIGAVHPVRRVAIEIARYFTRHGFAVVLGPEIETDANNFDALNIPPDHPAREGLDSFYLRPDLVLRTHTSPMQVRSMRKHAPPIAIIVPGKAYRRDAIDARHLYMFHQVEGLMVGRGIHFGHLKGMLVGMCRELFGPSADVRFRPSFFPFTEPSAEIDVKCPACDGTGTLRQAQGDGAVQCRTCGGSGWIEIGGSGMVHPNVLRSVGYDPDEVAGWAFGCGLERIAMKRYDMNDIRAFVENAPGFAEGLA
ncbi:MAG: phenylalanine--tRNA ligase subunit alpha, partial [Candidatus Eremiobacteraeota bacterium]|nr:phenylalanine--tRNA ligase subunit alpha [Candidatus Eremiobacteraeota bacterium]